MNPKNDIVSQTEIVSETEHKESLLNSFRQELQKLTEKYQVRLVPNISFPIYKELPEEVQLAVKVIQKHGVRYVLEIVDST